MKKHARMFVLILMAVSDLPSLAANRAVKLSLIPQTFGADLERTSMAFPVGEIIFDATFDGKNSHGQLYLRTLSGDKILLQSETIGETHSAGLFDAFVVDGRISVLIARRVGDFEVWRFFRATDKWKQDGIGSLGSYELSAFDAKDEWRLSSPDEVRAESNNGDPLIFTVTHQPLIAGEAQMMVLKNGKPFHPFGLIIRGLENIPEDPWPRSARQGRDIVILPHENPMARNHDTVRAPPPPNLTVPANSERNPPAPGLQNSPSSSQRNPKEPLQTSAPRGWGFGRLACLCVLLVMGWIVSRVRQSRR